MPEDVSGVRVGSGATITAAAADAAAGAAASVASAACGGPAFEEAGAGEAGGGAPDMLPLMVVVPSKEGPAPVLVRGL